MFGKLFEALQWQTNALWESCNIGWKINQKVVNFGKWFLCQFSPKTWNFLHGAFLTPQKLEDEKVLTNLCMQRGEKEKNVKRVFFTDKMGAKKLYCWMLWYLLFEHLWKLFHLPIFGELRKLHAKKFMFSVKIGREINFQSWLLYDWFYTHVTTLP